MPPVFPASTTQGGQCMGFPDVCKTPTPVGPIPIPYPNMGMKNQAKKTSKKVEFAGKPVITLKSEIKQSMGDEAGTAGGLISGKNRGEIKFKKGSAEVKVEGQPCIRLTSMTAQNGTNANVPAGAQVAPSQDKVIVS